MFVVVGLGRGVGREGEETEERGHREQSRVSLPADDGTRPGTVVDLLLSGLF